MPDQLLLVSVGNTRTRFAMVRDGQLEPSRVELNSDAEALARAILSHRGGGSGDAPGPGEAAEGEGTPALIASVNPPVSAAIERAVAAAGRHCSRLGTGPDDLPIPISLALNEHGLKTVGADRLLDALGAFSRAQSACVVIDAGTAITVDFVDGEGAFQGGAIAPGVAMMLASLHQGTSSLPQVAPGATATGGDDAVFGKDTPSAMMLGALSAARGLAHLLIDRYAEYYQAYPRVIATGGDAGMLFENDTLVEHIVPDLTLVGMWEAYQRLEQLEDEPEA